MEFRQTLGKPWANLRQNLGKTLGKPWANLGHNLEQTSAKPQAKLRQNLEQKPEAIALIRILAKGGGEILPLL